MPKKTFPALVNHHDCETLTTLTVENAPRDGSLGRNRRYRKGANVWRPDDRSDSIFFLRQGEIAIVAGDSEGRELVLGLIRAGEPFGELCFCAPQKRLYRETYARAVVESEAGEVKLTDFIDYLQSDREALVNLVFIYCVRLSDAQHRLEALAQRGAVERLGRLLLHLANTRGIASDENAEEVILSVSHDELAKMAAMSRPHVTVTMGALRRRGLVGYGRNRPLVVNVEALAKYLNR